MSSATRDMVTEDFEQGKAFVTMGLTMKLDFWNRPPWKFCGMAHHNASTARRVAKECLEQFDAAAGIPVGEVANTHLFHPVTKLFMGPLRGFRADRNITSISIMKLKVK